MWKQNIVYIKSYIALPIYFSIYYFIHSIMQLSIYIINNYTVTHCSASSWRYVCAEFHTEFVFETCVKRRFRCKTKWPPVLWRLRPQIWRRVTRNAIKRKGTTPRLETDARCWPRENNYFLRLLFRAAIVHWGFRNIPLRVLPAGPAGDFFAGRWLRGGHISSWVSRESFFYWFGA